MFPPCPKCHSDQTKLAYRAKDYNRKINDEFFDYYRCGCCGYIFLSPQPTHLGQYYQAEYYEIPKTRAQLRNAAKIVQYRLDHVLRYKRSGRLLEIGPAYGLFSFLAKEAGFDVTAIEMDVNCCRYLRDTVGISVVENADTIAALEELPLFDVIALWQVIEHLPDPWVVLTAAAKHLAPGGIIIIDTPNPSAFQFRVLGKYWTHLDAPRHVTLIPEKLLTQHMKSAGLEPAFLSASDYGANGFNGFGWAVSFRNFFRNSGLRAATHLFGRAFAKLLIPIERTGWRGSTYIAIYHKGDVR